MHAYRIFPLGDTGLTVDFGNRIDEEINRLVIGWFDHLRESPLPGMTEVVPAYSSFTIYYDIIAAKKKAAEGQTGFDLIKAALEQRLTHSSKQEAVPERLVRIPVCYKDEFAPDLPYLANEKKLAVEEVIRIHTQQKYKLYMLGFLPGFSYMGEVDEKIAMPRKPQPQLVEAGGVGIAGRQTGIYPLQSPGGWQIIGRTPLKLFDPYADEPCLLRAGDRVEFYSISKKDFFEIQNPPSLREGTGRGL
jgi:inhibitor of KinA